VYFFFNEGDGPLNLNATVAAGDAANSAQTWDANTGLIEALSGASFAQGKATLPLSLESWGTQLIVVLNAPAGVASNL